MPIVTTENLSNPKPVRGVDYAGQLMKSDGYYNGRPEHQSPNEPAPNELPNELPKELPKARVKRRSRVSAWTAEKRAAYSQRMREWHVARKAGTAQPGPET